MDSRFYDIYNKIYWEYGTELGLAQGNRAQEIRDRIDNAIDEQSLSERVRPDARLYLLVNFHRLTVVPLIEGGSLSTDEISNHLSDDIGTILRRARDLADSREKKEISGHVIADAVSEDWDKLKLSSTSAWF